MIFLRVLIWLKRRALSRQSADARSNFVTPSTNLCKDGIYPGLFSLFFSFFLFFLFSIDPQVLHDLEREYDNEFLASIDPEQPVNSRTNYLDRK